MSEMQKLKEEADKQYALQRMEEVGKYLDELSAECLERLKWSLRCDVLEMVAFISYWVILITGILMDAPEWVADLSTDLMFIVLIVAVGRSWGASARWREKEGEWKGAVTVLRKLGMLKDYDGGNSRKRVKKFDLKKLVAETWEKIGLKQKKGSEAYA